MYFADELLNYYNLERCATKTRPWGEVKAVLVEFRSEI